jgi:hypothetical protein
MTAKVAGALYWTAICLAVLSIAGFGYQAAQPNAFNPIGLVGLGVGLACLLWLGGVTCKYLIKPEEVTTHAVCAGCGHAGVITWKRVGGARRLVDSHCFYQRPNDRNILCKRCEAALPE